MLKFIKMCFRIIYMKNKRRVLFKSFVIVIIVTFVWLYIKLTDYDINDESVNISKSVNAKHFEYRLTTNVYNSLNMSEIVLKVNEMNGNELVLNSDIYGTISDNDIVIVVQVHRRVQYFANLIESLNNTKFISNVLLIISHDFFDDQINSIVKSIRFCKVIQIFYPYSLQLFNNTFPADSANDCPRDISKADAIKLKCINAEHSDSYGHYREAKYTQTKHHWWWKINHVMDRLRTTRNHSGYFMFIEEDHYFSPDTLYVLRKMNQFRRQQCEKCDILTLGTYAKSPNFETNGNKIEITKWFSSKHNMGFLIDRGVWHSIKLCSNMFCTYDDYNWDWSLQWISDKCLSSPLTTIVVSSPRVFHTGECGVHHKGKDCNSNEIVHKLQNMFKSSKDYLFPSEISLQKGNNKKVLKQPKPNGGWSDVRDHKLCLKQIVI